MMHYHTLHTSNSVAIAFSPLTHPVAPPFSPSPSISCGRSPLSARRRQCPCLAAAAPAPTPAGRHQDADGRCVFGKREYWDALYSGDIDETSAEYRPADEYSWYCGHAELAPFWRALVPDRRSRIVVAGVGNDVTSVDIYDAGWTNLVAYDYSRRGVERARKLFGSDRAGATLMVADARNLPLSDASVDATLDKGTLDAIYITGAEAFEDAVREMGRVTTAGGVVVCVSGVVGSAALLGAFDAPLWETVHDGTLAFAPDGEATIDLGAELFSWKRTAVPYRGGDFAAGGDAS